jgi:hypothetical protein
VLFPNTAWLGLAAVLGKLELHGAWFDIRNGMLMILRPDQQLIRNEMEIGRYPRPSDTEAGAMVRKFRQEHYGLAQFCAALEKYGVTEDELKQHLLWQLAALRFTDQRFHSAVPEAPTQSADRSGADQRGRVDQQMAAWLKETRAGTRIQFKQGAFE